MVSLFFASMTFFSSSDDNYYRFVEWSCFTHCWLAVAQRTVVVLWVETLCGGSWSGEYLRVVRIDSGNGGAVAW